MTLRIVAGAFGSRRLRAPRGPHTRPTADRVREALFSVLFDVTDWRVLDLYAGSGAVGLEALSRGAQHACFVERARPALDAVRDNIAALDLPEARAEVLAESADSALGRLRAEGRRFELVFADPPYADAPDALPRVLEAAAAIQTADGHTVLEHRHDLPAPVPPDGIVHVRTKRYGEAALSFYRAG